MEIRLSRQGRHAEIAPIDSQPRLNAMMLPMLLGLGWLGAIASMLTITECHLIAVAGAAEPVSFEVLGGDQCFMFSQLVHYRQQGSQYVAEPLELVINDTADYRKLFSPDIRRESCAGTDSSTVLPAVDFATKTVLGLWESGSCSDREFVRSVTRDDSDKVVTYRVSMIDAQISCSGPGLEGLNLIAVPKILPGYRVIFESTR